MRAPSSPQHRGQPPYRPWLPALLGLVLCAACDDAPPAAAADERGEWAPSGKSDEIASCSGACGGQSAAGCWCDDQCEGFGDCCPDLQARCGTDQPASDDDGGAATCSLPSDGAWSCGGLTGVTTNPDGIYYATSFGCWVDAQGNAHSDGGDNCLPACSLASIGCSGKTGPQCERAINWYTADADRFGCGTKLLVTNPDNGKSAVLMAIDRGPNCRIERKVDHWVLDISTRASLHFFGESTAATERADLHVEIVDPSTPLGPTTLAPQCG
jgi:Somatomedin B domain